MGGANPDPDTSNQLIDDYAQDLANRYCRDLKGLAQPVSSSIIASSLAKDRGGSGKWGRIQLSDSLSTSLPGSVISSQHLRTVHPFTKQPVENAFVPEPLTVERVALSSAWVAPVALGARGAAVLLGL